MCATTLLRRLLTASLLVSLIAAGTAHTHASNWIISGDGNYNTSGNWSAGVPNGVDATADFSTVDISTDVLVDIDANVTLGQLVFGDTNLGSAGTWAISDDDATPAIMTFDAASKPTITVGELTPTALFDDSYLGVVLAGTNGFRKLGPGILTTAAYEEAGGALRLLNHSINGSIDIEAGTFRINTGAFFDDTEPGIASFKLFNGATLESTESVALNPIAVDTGATVNVTSIGSGNTSYEVIGNGTGEIINYFNNTSNSMDIVGQTSLGFAQWNISGDPNSPDRLTDQVRLNINNNTIPANNNTFANSKVHLDAITLSVRTNSFGNDVAIGELSGTSTGALAGGGPGWADEMPEIWEI